MHAPTPRKLKVVRDSFGSNKMCQFFVKTYCLWHKQLENEIILKTIGNRKGDCAWSCSRWQTQPEKICKSQRTNQCHSLRTLYWFVRCDLQIFSGCVCHLEQLHAQSPFLFPIVFSINLIPFFDICSVDYLLFFHPGCSYLGRCAVATVHVAVCSIGSWYFVIRCGLPRSRRFGRLMNGSRAPELECHAWSMRSRRCS